MKICVVGGGISGVTIANLLKEKHEVLIFEKESKIGGLIKCEKVNGFTYHKVGGHVFNSKNKNVLDWFWSKFDKENEFITAKRNAKILINDKYIGYPIENHLYLLEKENTVKIFNELLSASKIEYDNFYDFLLGNFGKTLFDLYFLPYNNKIWKRNLKTFSLKWLDSKLPIPNLGELIISNIYREEENKMVHSSFYYPQKEGSQFIIDRLSEELKIKTNYNVESFFNKGKSWIINDEYEFDKIIFTGYSTHLNRLIKTEDSVIRERLSELSNLDYNGTSNVLCECDMTDISWLYIPDKNLLSHRIIYTGNFSPQNNVNDKLSCVVEFSGRYSVDEMKNELPKLPGNLKPIDFNSTKYSYIIQDSQSKERIKNAKEVLERKGFYLLGRFAEWEYYNMDKCIEAAMNLSRRI